MMEENPSFSKKNGFLQIAWDSTSLGMLKECPRKYYLSMIRQLEPKKERIPLTFGIHVHTILEHAAKMQAEKKSHKEVIRGALEKALEISGERIAETFLPWATDCTKRNRHNLARLAVHYLDHYNPDPAETIVLNDGKPAVELSFRINTDFKSSTDENFILCGHLDRLVKFNGSAWVLDHKTTTLGLREYYFNQFKPNNQMLMYALGANVVYAMPVKGVIIDAVEILVNSENFARHMIIYTEEQLEEFLASVSYWLAMADFFATNSFWPMNEKSCSMWGGCEFREVCGSTPKTRDIILANDFKHKVWNPLENRNA